MSRTTSHADYDQADKLIIVLVLRSHTLYQLQNRCGMFKPTNKRSSRNCVITFHNHLKTALYWIVPIPGPVQLLSGRGTVGESRCGVSWRKSDDHNVITFYFENLLSLYNKRYAVYYLKYTILLQYSLTNLFATSQLRSRCDFPKPRNLNKYSHYILRTRWKYWT